MGLASGMVGAGGTIGGAIFNAVFKALIGDPRMGFRIVGGVCAVGAVTVLGLRIGGVGILGRRK